MKSFRHLSLEEREKLYVWHEQGVSLREIGKRLRRHHASIRDELKRNRTGNGKVSNEYLSFKYIPCRAQEKADKRKREQRQKAPLKEPLIFLYVREHLRDPYRWSPETIAGRLAIAYPGKHITKETIYRYIYTTGKRYKLWKYLVLRRKKRMKSGGRTVHREGKIPGSVSIDLRPKEVDLRITIGHWETDNIIGKQTDTTVLSTTVERVTRMTLVDKLADRSATAKTGALTKRLGRLPQNVRVSLTADNGKENSYHQQITQNLGMSVYFCHAYHSWEKGTVENTNGRIRRFIPKGISIDTIPDEQIKAIEHTLNNTPRKCLGFLTPYEKMIEVLTR